MFEPLLKGQEQTQAYSTLLDMAASLAQVRFYYVVFIPGLILALLFTGA
jgi:hypothetical protein